MNPSSGNLNGGNINYSSVGTPVDATGSALNVEGSGDNKEEVEDGKEIFLETQISKLLSERITKIVIIIVLIMLFSQPLFTVKTFIELPGSSDSGLMYIRDYYDSNPSWSDFQNVTKKMIEILSSNSDYPVILMQLPDIT